MNRLPKKLAAARFMDKAKKIISEGDWPLVRTLLVALHEAHEDSGYCWACLHKEHIDVCPLHEVLDSLKPTRVVALCKSRRCTNEREFEDDDFCPWCLEKTSEF